VLVSRVRAWPERRRANVWYLNKVDSPAGAVESLMNIRCKRYHRPAADGGLTKGMHPRDASVSGEGLVSRYTSCAAASTDGRSGTVRVRSVICARTVRIFPAGRGCARPAAGPDASRGLACSMTSVFEVVNASSASVTGAPCMASRTTRANSVRLESLGLTMAAGGSLGIRPGGNAQQRAEHHREGRYSATAARRPPHRAAGGR